MQTVLVPVPHVLNPDILIIEVWHGSNLIGTVNGAGDYPGIRFITAGSITTLACPDDPPAKTFDGKIINVLEVRVGI